MNHTSIDDHHLISQVLPRHVAIIMDGNGRWAKRKGLPRIAGHKKGVEVARKIIIKSCELGIPYLSLFAFSKENWQRPREEVETLLALLVEYLNKELPLMMEKEIRFKVIGDKEDFPEVLRKKIDEVEKLTSNNNKMTLVLALSYSGRAEILRAIKKILEKLKEKALKPEEITEESLRNFFYFPELPDPDLLIRTSGELRISNFFLYQIAYTEFYFSEMLWPDFTEEEYLKALKSYQQRERRFGRVYEF
ncbi:UDP pyrophosphate synthase [Caldimicrobium thiodismutans]|uniref:Isoprenyl transferase n=1 Tax=Caldimicrobium thiodismutans TaxID=1653476 RepID=A0A0U5AZB9_9BACT|nr:isoprenyl transferase [Caldimicrobium thiodismutans]BAU23081.1 UDP pyrophosphate synthase [Caldimicrobium thiodismutans]